MVVTISRTDLARHTRAIVEQVQRGQPVVVQSYGQDQVVLLDIVDYRLLRALAAYGGGTSLGSVPDDDLTLTLYAYMEQRINLGKAAEQLGLSRFELMERFDRLGIPLRIGPATLEEARAEVETARQGRAST